MTMMFFLANKRELLPQGVDLLRGWGFRGVHKAIICGKIGQALQKILRNDKTVTVGTGGMYDSRTVGAKDLPKPAQFHRIAVHNEALGAYAVQQLVKNSSVYVEGDIKTRACNDSINGAVKNIPEICVRLGVAILERSTKKWYSTTSSDRSDNEGKNNEAAEVFDDDDDVFLANKRELLPQGVDPIRGWGFRGVHKAIICGKIGQAPMQKILRNGKTVTIFTVGTGGMYDSRTIGAKDLPKPAQWHRIAVHNEALGAYAVQQLVKNSSVYVEGDIETRVYNDSITGTVKNIPEICVRRDGKVRLIKTGEGISKSAIDELREGLS